MIPFTEEELSARSDAEDRAFDDGTQQTPGIGDFEKKLEVLINAYSMEGAGGNTPDFILARFLRLQLALFDSTVRRREHWHGRK